MAKTGFVAGLAFVLTTGSIAWASDLFRQFGLLLYTEQYLGGIVALALPLIFLSIRAAKSAPLHRIPWYDWLAAGLGFGACVFIAVRYPVLAELVAERPVPGLISGSILLLLMIEGLRRTVGMVLTLLVVFFIVMALFGHTIPGTLAGRKVEWQTLLYYLAWDPTGVLGFPMKVVTTIVVAFVFFGQVLLKSGGSQFFTEISMILVGRYRGGQAKIAVTASGFFGSISGSVVSNVVTTGVITIPLMRNAGYRRDQAGAIEAVASTGGQLMPPIMGAAAFLMAEFLEIPYKEVVLAALIPAVLYYVALFVLADLEAARSGIARVKDEDIPDLVPVLKSGWYFPIPFAALIGALFWLNFQPEMAAMLGTAVIIFNGVVFGYKGKRLNIKDMIEAVRDTGFAVLDIIMIGAAAGIVIGTLSISGIGFGLSLFLVELGGGNIVVLLIISALICIVLGMGMPTVGVYLLLATLIAPSLIEVGISAMAAHLFILYFGMMSMITPPVAIAAFAAATLSGANAMKTGFEAMRFGWFAYLVPFIFVASPELLMEGDAVSILLTVLAACIGVWLVSIAIIGFLVQEMNAVVRILFLITGLAFLIPEKAIGMGVPNDIVGIVLGVVLVTNEYLKRRRGAVLKT